MKMLSPEIQDKHLVDFAKTLEVRHFKSRETVFELHEVQKHVAFVSEGLVRAYFMDQQGDERTTWFVTEHEFVTDYPSFLTGKPSNYFFQTLEPAVLVFLPKTAIEATYARFHPVERYGRLVAEEILKIQQSRIETFLFKTAKERYLEVLECNPELVQRVSVGHLASYIGIERQSLTRIRKQIQEEK